MDYVSAGGEPVGFNTALISEIGKRLGVNIEFVTVDCGARGIALATGVCDIKPMAVGHVICAAVGPLVFELCKIAPGTIAAAAVRVRMVRLHLALL